MTRRPLIAGNWKMNGTLAQLSELSTMREAAEAGLNTTCDMVICPPATILSASHGVLGTAIAVGGQDCHAAASGAHTGDVSATMLKDVGATHVIVGHSERRAEHGESDATVRAKAEAALQASLVAIVCVGETEAERDEGRALDVIGGQLDGSLPEGTGAASVVVAYEPVWAIGTGRTPSNEDIEQVHAFIRKRLADRYGMEAAEDMRVLYGGSVKPANAEAILALADVDGALVGGASLKADDFVAIAKAVSPAV